MYRHTDMYKQVFERVGSVDVFHGCSRYQESGLNRFEKIAEKFLEARPRHLRSDETF